jgi:hypothetical protein
MKANRLASLESKHKDLHKKIEALEAEKAPDDYIKPLKQSKLVIKDEIESIRKSLNG